MEIKEIKRKKLIRKFIKEAIVLYPSLILISIFWIISFGWSTGITLTIIILLILSIPVVNWFVENLDE